ncbi:aminoacyl-tRNA hydrolase, putative [Talaromyces stipitatus ATCC 10500]|uniref:D-aminoacyl-tRNA deacylase n=1 Tax=Talaromyces stipitatus (strain ATCC 10500 / CBS 375.48 / QM 6759 / NRRL 1006) TaxID=441959 RepID=B8MCJ9_TALSN|nr:aminoacyl-tRNA hydrolase, putative [Talaromyces stipitatus ATCC 10500]EED18815.1 aminoacyl-tRNA hydrolase, putative [Talaromyces stipitatus ATCC 10500]
MKAVLQRVKSASVTVDNQLISSIGQGILVFAGVGREDTEKDVDIMASRVLKAKLWPDETNPKAAWKRNVQDIEGEVLCVSQFTLYGHIKKNKPDFHNAADVETARRLYDRFVQKVSDLYKTERVKNGVFQAMMEVELKNDGPVTIEITTDVPKSESSKDQGETVKTQTGPDGRKYVEFELPASLLE